MYDALDYDGVTFLCFRVVSYTYGCHEAYDVRLYLRCLQYKTVLTMLTM